MIAQQSTAALRPVLPPRKALAPRRRLISARAVVGSPDPSGLATSLAPGHVLPFARAASAVAEPAAKGWDTFASDNPMAANVVGAAGFAVALWLAVTALNAVRSALRAMWESSVKNAGPGSLVTAFLGVVLNIIGADLSSTTSAPPAGPAASANGAVPSRNGASPSAAVISSADMPAHLADRTAKVQKLFPGALSADDFIGRVETALCAYGFTADNSLALTNLCRDESTGILKAKIDAVFGHSFNVNGLGGVLTCGQTGLAAGLSHAPICPDGREKYVFFAFPHIGVDETGKPQAIYRPGRGGESAACGALVFCLNAVKDNGIDSCKTLPGRHKASEPEGSILASRLARRMEAESTDVASLDLVGITNLAQRTITSDLEKLIANGVDTSKADYAVLTGVQIHSWPNPATGAPAIEFVAPASGYVVLQGQRTELDLASVPALTPRQAVILATRKNGVSGSLPMAYVNKKLVAGVQI